MRNDWNSNGHTPKDAPTGDMVSGVSWLRADLPCRPESCERCAETDSEKIRGEVPALHHDVDADLPFDEDVMVAFL